MKPKKIIYLLLLRKDEDPVFNDGAVKIMKTLKLIILIIISN